MEDGNLCCSSLYFTAAITIIVYTTGGWPTNAKLTVFVYYITKLFT